MPRLPRFQLPGQPQHVIQRGNDRMAIFREATDYHVFATYLREGIERYRCEVHAYVFMSNHVHLLVSPVERGAIARMMQSVGRRYVGYFNRRYARTGTLWEGRYRATLIDSARYLFTCAGYIEQNPVRAGMVREAAEYRWSSFAANALGGIDPLITPHAHFRELGATARERALVYRAMTRQQLDVDSITEIREATNKGWALGGPTFRSEASRLGRRAYPLRSPRQPIVVMHTTP